MPAHERIKARREALGLTLAELESRLKYHLPGLDRSDLSRIENGLRKVSADEVPIFARALHCDPADLLDEKPE